MAFGKNQRPGKRSSSSSSCSCSAAAMIILVAFGLVGFWMYSSSSVVPLQKSLSSLTSSSSLSSSSRVTLPTFRFRPERRDQAKEKAFEDNPGDLPDDAIKGDEEKIKQKTDEVGSQEEEPSKESSEDDKSDKVTTSENPESGSVLEILQNQAKESTEEVESMKEEPQRAETDSSENHVTQDGETSETRRVEEEQEKEQPQQTNKENGDESQEKDKTDDQQPNTSDENANNAEGTSNKSENTKEETNPSGELDGGQSEEASQTRSEDGSWSTQSDQSETHKDRQTDDDSSSSSGQDEASHKGEIAEKEGNISGYTWNVCNATAGADYIPCLDNEAFLKTLHARGHYEHRERHCPEESVTCLVPLPKGGYKHSIEWPRSRDKIWYVNVPHTKLADVKGHQNWVKVSGEYLLFPGGGTQFIHGALHYIDFLQKSVPRLGWGKHSRVVLDVGCGVASLGGYLFERDVLTMSFAPKDEHEAQVQLALERGIPAISAVMGTQRLPFPSNVFDVVHCARCRVPWHAEGGRLLLELNRLLRPGGFFVWSATPVYQKLKEDVEIWKEMSKLTQAMCWDLVTIKKDKLNSVGAAFYRKPISNECYEKRQENVPALCDEKDDANAAWYVPLQSCMHRIPVHRAERGSRWPEDWPSRVVTPPYWLNHSETGVYGKHYPEDLQSDTEQWKQTVENSYLQGMGIDWPKIRNVMDMRAVYGGFAAALKDLKLWVMNVVNTDSADTLPIIYERGLFGIYHDWCESFSTYPRTYDLLHADHLFSQLKNRCDLVAAMAEVDRILRPGGKMIIRDESSTMDQLESLIKSLHWEVQLTFNKDNESILCAQKTDWRPMIGSSDS